MAPQQCTNIKVYSRIRGQNEKDEEALNHSYTFLNENSMLLKGKQYTFDQVFHQSSSQEQVYNNVARPIVTSVMEGYNGTIFAYGQTSSGKTHTMEGDLCDKDKLGIIPRAVHDIFSRTKSLGDFIKWEIKASYYEIYMEKPIDLLCNSTKGNLVVYEDKKRMAFISGLKEVAVKNVQELMDLFTEAKQKRHVSETESNKVSSRSHTVFQIVIKQENSVERKRVAGKLLLIDLAGSERACYGDESGSVIRRESSYINRSLSVLSRVISVLTSNSRDLPPYRESCLTRLLKESIGGNSQTAIVICIRPSSESETKYSLEFGMRAKTIQNSLQLNVKLTESRLSRLWERLQKSIRSTNTYIEGSVTELQRWRSGESVPEEEWTPLFECGKGDSFSESSPLDASDSVQNSSNSQIFSDSSFFETSGCDLDSSVPLRDSEDISGLIRQVEALKTQYQQLPLLQSKQVKSKEELNMKEKCIEMIKLKEELAFYKERNLIHHEENDTMICELKNQEIRCRNLSSMLIAETRKSIVQEAKTESRKMFEEKSLEILSERESNPCSPKRLHAVCKSINEKLRHITGLDLKATLHADNIQDQIFKLFSNLQCLSQFRDEQEQRIAEISSEKDSAIEKNMSLQEELCNLNTSHAAAVQALKTSILEKMQHLKIKGLQESLCQGNIQDNVMKLCDQLISLSDRCDLQEEKIAAVSEERDAATQSLASVVREMDNLRKTHDSEKQLFIAKINNMSEDITNLHIELEKNRSCELHLREKNEANEVKISSLEEERILSKEETCRMEILLLEKANAENLLATRLCCLEEKNRILTEELEKLYFFREHMLSSVSFLNKFDMPPFDVTSLDGNTVIEENNVSSEELNNNEVLASDLFLDNMSPEDIHFKTHPGSEETHLITYLASEESTPSSEIEETGEVRENFSSDDLGLGTNFSLLLCLNFILAIVILSLLLFL